MPIRILSASEKRKAKRGVTPGRSKTHWPKTPYKDYTKIKYSPFIKTGTGKKGMLQEQAGAPGGEKKLHDKSMKRLNELQKLKSREGTRMTSGAQRKRKEHLQSGGYKEGGRPLPSPGPGLPKKWKIPKYQPRITLRDRLKKLTEKGRPSPGRPGGKGKEAPDKRWFKGDKSMTPLRAKHGIGSLVKKVISKIKPKPKGKGKGLGSGIKPSEMHEIIPKKDRKLYLQEFANPHKRGKKAKGGPVRPIHIPWPKKRVKKGHGGSAAQQHYLQHGYGPHKIQLRSGKPKLAKKGW